jgi:hypothetical protein
VALKPTVHGRPGTGWQPPPLVTVTVGGRFASAVGVGSGVGVALGEGVGLATGGPGRVGRASSSQAESASASPRAVMKCAVVVRRVMVPPVGGQGIRGAPDPWAWPQAALVQATFHIGSAATP